MVEQASDLEVYPNAPLVDVVCEIRFPGELEVESSRADFWNQIRDHYPDILVPNAEAGKPPALQHYRFRNDSGTRSVAVALNSLAFSETVYSGHVEYIEEFSRLADLFHECYPKIEKVNRIGWRYINVIPFTRQDGLVPVGQFLDASLVLPKEVLKSPKTFDIKAESVLEEGTVILRLAVIKKKDSERNSQEAMLLDIDFGYEGDDLKFSGYKKCVEHARRHNRNLFEELITNDYRQYLRGETL